MAAQHGDRLGRQGEARAPAFRLWRLKAFGSEVRPAEPYFEGIAAGGKTDAVALATQLIKQMSGRFEPEKMPDEYASAVKELVQAKIEQRAPQVQIAQEAKAKGAVVNIMDALKKSMQKQGQAKVLGAVGSRMGKAASKQGVARPTTRAKSGSRRELH